MKAKVRNEGFKGSLSPKGTLAQPPREAKQDDDCIRAAQKARRKATHGEENKSTKPVKRYKHFTE
jgi:hypothetical protein